MQSDLIHKAFKLKPILFFSAIMTLLLTVVSITLHARNGHIMIPVIHTFVILFGITFLMLLAMYRMEKYAEEKRDEFIENSKKHLDLMVPTDNQEVAKMLEMIAELIRMGEIRFAIKTKKLDSSD